MHGHLTDLGSLPFYEGRSCTLGFLTVQYLEDVNIFLKDGETAESACKEAREKGQFEWFTSSDFGASLDNAFHLWDAVSHYQRATTRGSLLMRKCRSTVESKKRASSWRRGRSGTKSIGGCPRGDSLHIVVGHGLPAALH